MKPVQAIVSTLAGLSSGQRRPVRNGEVPPPCMTAQSRYARAGEEPTLDEALRDPVVLLMVRADGLDLADVQRALLAAGQR